MRVVSFVKALKEFSASVDEDNVEKIAISESFTRLFNIYCVCDGEIAQLQLFNFRSCDCKS
jgi:hypothetical protein